MATLKEKERKREKEGLLEKWSEMWTTGIWLIRRLLMTYVEGICFYKLLKIWNKTTKNHLEIVFVLSQY